jgi:CRISP-associated protein Cas1
LRLAGFDAEEPAVVEALDVSLAQIIAASNTSYLLASEAHLTKQLYKIAARNSSMAHVVRERDASDKANAFLNHGNYLAYGLPASTLWVLGIPHAFAVMHDKTRRGALVFDIADLVKDAILLPWSFICVKENATDQEFRQQCLQSFADHKALDFMFNHVKERAVGYQEEENE